MRTTMLTACAGLLWSCALVVLADEEKIAPDKAPKAVLESVAKRFPESKVVGVEKEVEEGEVLYEVEILHKIKPKKEGKKPREQKIDVTLTEDGKIVEIEKQISPKRLPQPVTDALNGKYPGSSVKKAETILTVKEGKEKFAFYEVLLQTEAKTFVEVCLAKDGKITKEEPKGADEEKE